MGMFRQLPRCVIRCNLAAEGVILQVMSGVSWRAESAQTHASEAVREPMVFPLHFLSKTRDTGVKCIVIAPTTWP